MKVLGIQLLLLLLTAAVAGAAPVGERPRVLLLTPEDLAGHTGGGEAPAPARDPFGWPPEQIGKLRAGQGLSIPQFLEGFTLNGIIWDPEKPMVMINGRLLGNGDVIADATISEISKDSVTLEQGGNLNTMTFQQSDFPFSPAEGAQ